MRLSNFKTNVIILLGIVVIVLLFPGCSTPTTSAYGGAKYHWNVNKEACAITKPEFVAYLNDIPTHVLSWKSFNKERFKTGFGANTKAWTNSTERFLQEGYSLDQLFHEGIHLKAFSMGDVGHSPKCWLTYKPVGYDTIVTELFDGVKLP